MDFVHFADNLARPILPVRAVRLVLPKPVDVEFCHVEVRETIDDPVGDQTPDPTPLQDAEGIESGGDEEATQLGGFADQR